MLLLGTASVLINLLICAIAMTYVWVSLRRRTAAGIFWRFNRDDQPILFWLQVLTVLSLALYQPIEIYYVLLTLVHVL